MKLRWTDIWLVNVQGKWDNDCFAIRHLSPPKARRLADMNGPNSVPPGSQLVAKDHAGDGKYHLLLAATGSVATIKIPNIVERLAKNTNLSIRIVLTEAATNFLQGQSEEQPDLATLSKYPNVDAIYRDADEWSTWKRGDPILHIELRRWSDALVIAPLSANTLADIRYGRCDKLLTSVVRAWQVESIWSSSSQTWFPGEGSLTQKPIVVAVAMNTAMWKHPLTEKQLAKLGHWFEILRPVEKELACGDTGDGAMHEWKDIVANIESRILFPGIIRDTKV